MVVGKYGKLVTNINEYLVGFTHPRPFRCSASEAK